MLPLKLVSTEIEEATSHVDKKKKKNVKKMKRKETEDADIVANPYAGKPLLF